MHINVVNKKLRAVLLYMHKLKSAGLPNNLMRQVYFALAASYLSYGLTAWGYASPSNLTNLEMTQRKFLRLLLGDNGNISSLDLYRKANILPVHFLCKLRTLLLYYYQDDFRVLQHSVRTTRMTNIEKYVVPRTRTSYGER